MVTIWCPSMHGFPVRVIVRGYAGVRSPKWLATITVQAAPSDNHTQRRDYKLLPPDIAGETVMGAGKGASRAGNAIRVSSMRADKIGILPGIQPTSGF